jgi:hypothetical protein
MTYPRIYNRKSNLNHTTQLGKLSQLAVAEAVIPIESIVTVYETYHFTQVVYTISILLSARTVVAIHRQLPALLYSYTFVS